MWKFGTLLLLTLTLWPNAVTAQGSCYPEPNENNLDTNPPSALEVEEDLPYCRTKVGLGQDINGSPQANRGVFWPYNRRKIQITPVFSTCQDACVGKTNSATMTEALQRAMNEWNTAGDEFCSDIEFQISDEQPTITYTNRYPDPAWGAGGYDGKNVIVWRRNNWVIGGDQGGKFSESTQRNLLAVTNLRYEVSCGEIYDADITFNGEDFQWTTDDSIPTGGKVSQIQPVLLHELGHVLGFNHVESGRSVMYHANNRNETKLQSGEIQGLCDVYPTDRPNLGDCYVHRGRIEDAVSLCSVSDAAHSPLPALPVLLSLLALLARRPSKRHPESDGTVS